MKIKRIYYALPLVGLGALGHPYRVQAQAWDASLAGKIIRIQNSAPGNYSFRVTLDSDMSTCQGNMAYINTSDGNYQTKVATLLTAYALQNRDLVDNEGFIRLVPDR